MKTYFIDEPAELEFSDKLKLTVKPRPTPTQLVSVVGIGLVGVILIANYLFF